MAKYCTRCGKPLQEGQVCSCQKSSNSTNSFNDTLSDKLLNRINVMMGLVDPDRVNEDEFETDKRIVPDCVESNENEIPVKQYTVATMRKKVLGITYSKAVGRIQATNQRVLLRATGHSIAGKTILQHEFAIDEIAGIEARREYVFNFWDLLLALFAAIIGGLLMNPVYSVIDSWVVALLLGIAACVPFFTVKKHLLLKLLCLGGSVGLLYNGNDVGIFEIFVLVPLALAFWVMFVYAVRPNLVLQIKTKSAHNAINIKRESAIKSEKENHTGYTEIIPEKDAEKAIQELYALINDIQKMGDFGVEKWKV